MNKTPDKIDTQKPRVEPIHIEHTVEPVGKNDNHKWLQRGVEMVCDGNNDHFRHGFRVEPELVFVDETNTGLRFKNVITGEEVFI